MPDETEPTPAAPGPDEEQPADRTEGHAARTGVQVPKWLAVGVVVVALAGGGFAVGRATASDHHGRLAPIGAVRPDGGPGGGPGGRGGPGFGPGSDRNGPGSGGDSTNNGSDGSNGQTTPSTTAGDGT